MKYENLIQRLDIVAEQLAEDGRAPMEATVREVIEKIQELTLINEITEIQVTCPCCEAMFNTEI